MAPNLNFNLWLPDDHPEMSSHFSNGWALPGDQTVRVSGAGRMEAVFLSMLLIFPGK